MKRCLTVLLLMATLATDGAARRAYAHHSFAATYLETQSVTIEGELVEFLFRNPHSFVQLMVTEKDGTMVRYAVEWGGIGQLGGQGVTRDTFKPGDHLIISGAPGRNPDDHRVRMVSLFRPRDSFSWGHLPNEVVN
jgi:uncharacterized protein DUF6152